MNISQRDRDLGMGYANEAIGHPDRTDRGRSRHPMEELLRRYWHPVGLVADATGVPAKSVSSAKT